VCGARKTLLFTNNSVVNHAARAHAASIHADVELTPRLHGSYPGLARLQDRQKLRGALTNVQQNFQQSATDRAMYSNSVRELADTEVFTLCFVFLSIKSEVCMLLRTVLRACHQSMTHRKCHCKQNGTQ